MAITKESDAEDKKTEMGHRIIVLYGLFCVEGYVSANLAGKTTGFSEEDLALFRRAILNMLENDHETGRGKTPGSYSSMTVSWETRLPRSSLTG